MLTVIQKRVLCRLLSWGDWVSAYQLKESVRTLNVLVKLGLAEKEYVRGLGSTDTAMGDKYRAITSDYLK